MQTQTVSVAYVNPPKNPKGPGSIKDTEGRYWKVWPKDTPLDRFVVGQSYDVAFETEQYQGKDQYIVKTATPRGAPVQSQAQTPRQPTAPSDGRRMFICSIVNAYIQAGKLDLRSDSLVNAINVVGSAYDQTLGA